MFEAAPLVNISPLFGKVLTLVGPASPSQTSKFAFSGSLAARGRQMPLPDTLARNLNQNESSALCGAKSLLVAVVSACSPSFKDIILLAVRK